MTRGHNGVRAQSDGDQDVNGDVEERASLMSTLSTHPKPATITKLIKRLRALTLKLLPVQVELEELTNPTSRVITPKVVQAYSKAAGDFTDCLPYCLLRARQTFMWDANSNPADYDENVARAVACEVLARRILHRLSPEKLYAVMSDRMMFREWDGDDSALSSALETAIDQHCTTFLSSNESQQVINSLWRGDWVQQPRSSNEIAYVQYKRRTGTLSGYLEPSRIGVPRYQNWMRIIIWFVFLFVYSMTVQQPLEMTLEPRHPFDEWEYLLYGMTLAFTFEDIDKITSTLRFFTWKALGFWHVVAVMTDALLVTAFAFRVVGIRVDNDDRAALMKLQSFQILSCVAPLIWMKLITVADGFKYIGTMQICVSRMLKESGIFFVLLAVLGLGFGQSMYAIDVSDGKSDRGVLIVNNLIQGLLGAPDFTHETNPVGLTVFYLWNIITTIILLNILISLFSSAYSDVTDDASAHFLAFFASKTVAMIRAPDEFVYPAPANLVELFLVAPTEFFLSKRAYEKYNRVVMKVLFFIPLLAITFFESHLDVTTNQFMKNMFNQVEEGEEDDPANRDPNADEEEGLEICKTEFEDLVKEFPDTAMSAEASILNEIRALALRVEVLTRKIGDIEGKKE